MCLVRFTTKNASRALVAECHDFGCSASVRLRSSLLGYSSFALGVLVAQAMAVLLPILFHLLLQLLSLKFPCGISNFTL